MGDFTPGSDPLGRDPALDDLSDLSADLPVDMPIDEGLPEKSPLGDILNDFNPLAFGLLENYYMANGCFLTKGQLIKNANKLKNIPVILINEI